MIAIHLAVDVHVIMIKPLTFVATGSTLLFTQTVGALSSFSCIFQSCQKINLGSSVAMATHQTKQTLAAPVVKASAALHWLPAFSVYITDESEVVLNKLLAQIQGVKFKFLFSIKLFLRQFCYRAAPPDAFLLLL